MPASRADLEARLAEMGIVVVTKEHAPAFTAAESSAVDLGLPGAHTKNLFLRDDEGTLVLVIAKSSTKIDLKALSKRLAAGRFSFAKPDLLMTYLGVMPGSVTAFAVINDPACRVKVIIDQELFASDSLNCHPLENTATTNIARDDLLRFIRATGHEPKVVTLAASATAATSI
ncbi:MAG: prolyl-tRNA synthetase associated domain-containing protein [Hyphomicrobium sp.]|nr:prolyl-tRNA synthetase associated domain-containing protein [Hyphomicrobium sp.]